MEAYLCQICNWVKTKTRLFGLFKAKNGELDMKKPLQKAKRAIFQVMPL
jgi:hypothetical protein